MNLFRALVPVMMLAVLLSSAACSKKKKPEIGKGHFSTDGSELTGTDGTAGNYGLDGTMGTSGNAPELAGYESARDASGSYREELGGEMAALGMPVPELQNVFFALDKYDLDQTATAVLEKNAKYLETKSDLYVILRGHTDDQGTEEYNISLGSRRAQAVRDFLVEKNINPDRLQTVSFGESLKLVEGEDEASRSQNRRVEFFVYTLEATQ